MTFSRRCTSIFYRVSYFGVLRVLELVAGKHCETKWLGTDMRGWIPGIKGCLGARY